MKLNLFPFQKTALTRLRMQTANALGNYHSTRVPQIVSYTAPTGAGKTIIMSALIESIFYGDDMYPDQTNAIFVWLSDSPQLNEQSKDKIDRQADKIALSQCVTITDDSFDMEVLEDGHIYFLNTQKLSKSSNLTKRSDGRQFTIWQTLSNTVRDKSDRLYFIIDEAHRGAKSSAEMARATTIMQKFLKGDDSVGLKPMPVVIGMTATPARFLRLAQGISSTTHQVTTTADEVRQSGLLKDRIVITYPEIKGNDMAVLQAATDEWQNKWDHWDQYCKEQHVTQVYPVFVIQVQNGSGHQLSATDMDECLRTIEERTGVRFSEGQVVHAFGEGTSTITINGLPVHYVEPSRIADDRRIKLVFFKEALSTGWDCPRAETMMSFRRATDDTYIAQLLGRMIRTPTQQHILVDDTLNDVHLYLPQFDRDAVYGVVEALKGTEGANIPTDIEAEQMGAEGTEVLTIRPTYTTPPRQPHRPVTVITGQMSMFGDDPEGWNSVVEMPQTYGSASEQDYEGSGASSASASAAATQGTDGTSQAHGGDGGASGPATATGPVSGADPGEAPAENADGDSVNTDTQIPDIDREAVVKAVNESGLLTYHVRKVRITSYLKSLFAMANFLTMFRLNMDAKDEVLGEIVQKIHDHIEVLKQRGEYEALAAKVMEFKMSTQVFDVFGRSLDDYTVHDIFSSTDSDIDRQFRLAENQLCNEGVGKAYGKAYYFGDSAVNLKIHVIIFAANVECMNDLQDYAEQKFHDLNDTYRRRTTGLPERIRKKYDDIVSDGDIVSQHNFRLPEEITVKKDKTGKVYYDHLFVDNSGSAMIHLNGWEEKVIEEEEKRADFVCWLRNPSRGSWALCVPYEMDGEQKPMYPDFLVIRRDGPDYIVDILEPHNPSYEDNLGKAKGLAEYARQNPGVGRIQLIRMKDDSVGNERPFRLDMSKSSIRDKVSHCTSSAELKNIFESDGFFED